MRLSRRTVRLPLLVLLACPLLPLAACDETPPQTSFAPLHYDYLSVLHLNVGTVTTVDNGQPGSVPGDISGRAPTPPDQALLRMAADRLMAVGNAGSAIFTIDGASILHLPGGVLEGRMDVHLDIVTANGQHAGYAEAHVRRTFRPNSSDGDGNADTQAHLYTLTSQMMQDMNVELEFQVRHHLTDWLVENSGAASTSAIQQQALGLPGAPPPAAPEATPDAAAPAAAVPATPATADTPPAPAAPAATTPAAPPADDVPDAVFPTGVPSDATPAAPRVMSPKPGYLTLPPGTPSTPAAPSTSTGGY
ncbi:hypothetical protein JUN65_19950 [Gluconacetobacter azotocaptans]|uniref:hypothetical protein n=1 Tax=Gluconacetobacter azotocaptans TaxID=142834 RepID=UPI00195ABB93|nr:hypothetical protein [Gluconacetobacter azotocaptans]MBM9403836.1 hypothetical protein [Gluconacetobacter azotocaptans]